MTPTSLLPKIAAAAGFDFTELCEAILARARLHTARSPSAAGELVAFPTPAQAAEDGLAAVVPRRRQGAGRAQRSR
jgi:hypothetical protein